MRTALFALTVGGAALADRLAGAVEGGVTVHLPERLGEIVFALHAEHLAVKRLRMVQPRMDKAPNLMLIEAVKGAALTGMRHEPALIVRDAQGQYTEEICVIYGGRI